MPSETIHKRFSAAAATYDHHATVQRRVADSLMRLLPPDAQPAHILEAGCGTGLLTEQLLDRFPQSRITALDLSSSMIDVSREKLGRRDRVTWYASGLSEFQTGSQFPLFVSNAALHWVEPQRAAFEEIRRLLDDEGLLVCSIMIDGTLRELRESRLHVAPHRPPLGRLPLGKEILEYVEAAGLSIERWHEDTIAERYASTRILLRSIHDMGLTGGAVSRASTPLQRGELRELAEHYDATYAAPGGGIAATYKVMYVKARAS